ncbi:hypothetical protein OG21DRAFT_1487453 [Imleria badia]|nr:hypothetical protein OG21DRAFT_1487453 [Imleria badia]
MAAVQPFEIVCDFLDPPTLARLARTRRTFEEPALDALWKVVDGLDPLVRLLPNSVWTFDQPDGTVELDAKYNSSNKQLQAIAIHPSPPFEPFPQFPKLKAIRGAFPAAGYIPIFYWLTGPSLTDLDIPYFTGDLASQTLIDFVSDMGPIYPNMNTFSLNELDKPHPDAMIQGLSKSIRSWKHLVCVELNSLLVDMDTAAYEHLMRPESLTSLILRL